MFVNNFRSLLSKNKGKGKKEIQKILSRRLFYYPVWFLTVLPLSLFNKTRLLILI